MIKALIFDFDGLILDTETHEYEVLQEIFEEHGSVLPLSVWGKVIGTAAGFRPFDYLEEQIGKKLNHEEAHTIEKRAVRQTHGNRKSETWCRSVFECGKGFRLKNRPCLQALIINGFPAI